MEAKVDLVYPLDKLRRMLYVAWIRAHPRIPDTTAVEHAKIFWSAYMNDSIPEVQGKIQDKIRELNAGYVVPKDGPTLNELWYSDKRNPPPKEEEELRAIYKRAHGGESPPVASSSRGAMVANSPLDLEEGKVLGKRLDAILKRQEVREDAVVDYHAKACDCVKHVPPNAGEKCWIHSVGENGNELLNQFNMLWSDATPITDLPDVPISLENLGDSQEVVNSRIDMLLALVEKM